ncbi:hypothetical protein BKA56DRAFT_582085 [Ilyonectria sp. MPI-CAGE-AT-0026]|nr:hypothetical protein BKA56DRAFT_582085 [Ilyonectria sp. MPI-CAGE-AT-0026]
MGHVLPRNSGPSNFSHGWTSVQVAMVVTFSITFTLSTASLVIRYVSSAVIVKKLEIDVILITIAWGAALGHFLGLLLVFPYGLGQHVWDTDPAELPEFKKRLLAALAPYVVCPAMTKLAILSVLYRISPGRWFRIFTYSLALIISVYTIVFIVILAGPCNPIEPNGSTCIGIGAKTHAALNITTDVIIIILPLPTLWKLQMPFRKKLVAGGILTLGSAVLLASIARAPYVAMLANNGDFYYTLAKSAVWSMLELNLGIVCSNLMRMKPFISRYFPRLAARLGLSLDDSAGYREGTTASHVRVAGLSHASQLHRIKGGEGDGMPEDSHSENPHAERYGISMDNRSLELDNRSTESILRQ